MSKIVASGIQRPFFERLALATTEAELRTRRQAPDAERRLEKTQKFWEKVQDLAFEQQVAVVVFEKPNARRQT